MRCGTSPACRPTAADQGKRLLTFTVETSVRFEKPENVHAFTDELAEAVRAVVERYDTEGGRPYRLIAAGHPEGKK